MTLHDFASPARSSLATAGPRLRLAAAASLLLALMACAGPQQHSATPVATLAPVQLRLLAINDFHGNLQPPQAGFKPKSADPAASATAIPAGGAAYLASAVQTAREAHANQIFVAAGDLIGASPLLSALFHDEPTIDALSLMGLNLSAVGNHEFDGGLAELRRKQTGGCHPVDGCRGPQPFQGAGFQYLAASTVELATGKTVFPAYQIRSFEGVPVGFIGLTLRGTGDLVLPTAVQGLRFDDEADTVNKLVPELRAQGVETIVLLIHEGGYPTGSYNECPGISGPIVDIVKRLDKAVGVVVSGHTHEAYNCRIDDRLVTSGDKYGTVLSTIDLQLDRASHRLVSAQAENLVVRHDQYRADPAQTALIGRYELLARSEIERPVGVLGAAFTRELGPAGVSTLGQLIADAQLAATADPAQGGAEIAITNEGSLRADLVPRADGSVSFGQIHTAQPFKNQLTVISLSGAELLAVLEQQWLDSPIGERVLQPSSTLHFQWDARRPQGQRIVPGSVTIKGEPLDPVRRYRVTINNFLASGGDSFTVFKKGQLIQRGIVDQEALAQYLQARPRQTPAPLDRVQKLD